jgi:hypothetical protein
VWDPCACGGYCGFTWYTPNDIADMVASGQPMIRNNKRHIGNISEWCSDADDVLLIAEEYVRWGDHLWESPN